MSLKATGSRSKCRKGQCCPFTPCLIATDDGDGEEKKEDAVKLKTLGNGASYGSTDTTTTEEELQKLI